MFSRFITLLSEMLKYPRYPPLYEYEPAGAGGHPRGSVAKNIVLNRPVVGLRRNTATNILFINRLSLLAARISEPERTEVGDLKLHGDAALLLIVLKRLADELQIIVEASGCPLDMLLLHPAVQHLLLKRNVNLLVPVAGAFLLVIEGPHERVGEEDPDEALGIEIVGHHGAVGDALLDVELVQEIREVSSALLLFSSAFLLTSHFACSAERSSKG